VKLLKEILICEVFFFVTHFKKYCITLYIHISTLMLLDSFLKCTKDDIYICTVYKTPPLGVWMNNVEVQSKLQNCSLRQFEVKIFEISFHILIYLDMGIPGAHSTSSQYLISYHVC
jgi:hypothetical protein